MGKNSRRRRRRRKREQQSRALALVGGGSTWRLGLQVRELELAKGYDGLLRGMPEPVLIVGLYRVGSAHARLVGRYLYRFERPGGFPTKVAPRVRSDESLALTLPKNTRLAVLVVAVEEDSGRGLQALYAALEAGDAVVVWTDQGPAPEPVHLPELCARAEAEGVPHRVQLLLGEHDPSRDLQGDDFIDANLLWTAASVGRREHRMHLVAADGRNDWTAIVQLQLRGL